MIWRNFFSTIVSYSIFPHCGTEISWFHEIFLQILILNAFSWISIRYIHLPTYMYVAISWNSINSTREIMIWRISFLKPQSSLTKENLPNLQQLIDEFFYDWEQAWKLVEMRNTQISIPPKLENAHFGEFWLRSNQFHEKIAFKNLQIYKISWNWRLF